MGDEPAEGDVNDEGKAAPTDGNGEDKDPQGLLAQAAADAKAKADAEGEGEEGEEGEDKTPLGKVDDDGKPLSGKDAGDDPDDETPYYPEGLDKSLQGKDNPETIDKLNERYLGLRKQLAQGNEVPKTPEEYTKPEGLENENDDGYKVFSKVAHEHGISDVAFQGMLKDLTPALYEAGIFVAPMDPKEELAKLGDGGSGLVSQVLSVGDKLLKEGHFNEAMRVEWDIMGGTALGIQTITAFMRAYGEKGIPVAAAPAEGALSENALRARKGDPRGIHGEKEYDPDYAAETERLFKKHYGSQPAGTSRPGFHT